MVLRQPNEVTPLTAQLSQPQAQCIGRTATDGSPAVLRFVRSLAFLSVVRSISFPMRSLSKAYLFMLLSPLPEFYMQTFLFSMPPQSLLMALVLKSDVRRHRILCPVLVNNMPHRGKSEHIISLCQAYYFPPSGILFPTAADIFMETNVNNKNNLGHE